MRVALTGRVDLMNTNYREGSTPAAPGLGVDAFDEVDILESPEGVSYEVREAVVTPQEHGARLDRVLVRLAPEFSRSHLQALVEDGLVQVGMLRVRTNARRLRAGERLRVELRPTAESLAFRPEPMTLPIVHEDEHLIVLDKAAGLVVHPGAGNWSGTLLNGLLAHHEGAARLPRAGIVHRLDKDTSGLMVVGKTLEAVTALVRAIAARDVRRVYLALAHGDIGGDERWIDAPIGRDPATRLRMAVVQAGRPARTAVEPLARREGCTAMRCRLHTGRTHQIRVHLAWTGHPLVGDLLYGGREILGMHRQALHAVALGFEHPVLRCPLEFRASPPADFLQAWQRLSDVPPA